MNNQDWFMQQIESLGEGIGILMKKELSSIDFVQIKDENGHNHSLKSLLNEYIENKKYQEAYLIVNSLKYKLSVYDHKVVSDNFISILKKIAKESNDECLFEKIPTYSKLLNEL